MSKRLHLTFVLALILCLSLTACGSDNDLASPDEVAKGNELVTDMAFLDGMWSNDGLSMLYFNSEGGYYVYHSIYGPTGRGEFTDETGKPMINYGGFLYDFYLRNDGVLLPNQNGEGGDTPDIDHHTFRRGNEAEICLWELDNYDGMWQNAAGETIVIDASLSKYTACSPKYSSSGTIGDEEQGRGLYLYDDGSRAYICPSADGNSFTISSGFAGRYSEDGHFDGVFYRDGDIEAYTDLSNAEFYYDFWQWYFDGVNDYCLGDDYEVREDGLAYHVKDGKVYPAGWIPEERYDPTDDWSEQFAADKIPVLTGGALPFTNIQNLRSDNNPDGTYYYEDVTEDGLIVVNIAEQSCFEPDVQDMEDYLTACVLSLSDADTYELLSAEENEEYSENLSYPVYIVKYTAGDGEDTRRWIVFATDTDNRLLQLRRRDGISLV